MEKLKKYILKISYIGKKDFILTNRYRKCSHAGSPSLEKFYLTHNLSITIVQMKNERLVYVYGSREESLGDKTHQNFLFYVYLLYVCNF